MADLLKEDIKLMPSASAVSTQISPQILRVIEIWKAPQLGLPNVARWNKYRDKYEGVRPQNSLQHSHSIAVFGMVVLARLAFYRNLDQHLILSALTIHDVGEGEIFLRTGTPSDVHYIDKADNKDLEEYEAFRKRYEPLGYQTFPTFQRAFLLQYAGKNPACFPEDARKIMDMLQGQNLPEIQAFEAIEKLDYILYALEQYHERGNARIAVQVLRSQAPDLWRLGDKLNGCREELWTPKMNLWANDFLKIYEGQWIEKPGEV